MPYCPRCNSELTAAEVASQTCSKCGAPCEPPRKFQGTVLPEPVSLDEPVTGSHPDQGQDGLLETLASEPRMTDRPDEPAAPSILSTIGHAGEATLALGSVPGEPEVGAATDSGLSQSIMATFKAEPSRVTTYNVAERGTFARQRSLRDLNESGALDADYELLEKIGEGGMGIVYRARQCSMDREVAVKRIKAQAQSQENRDKFLLEAAITGELAHPNIVPIHDLGTNARGDLFYSMMVVRGESWQAVMGRKSRAENVEILLRVADAVAFAHSRDVVHRDLKPENVMLGAFGEVLVMDWGLAGRVGTGPPLPAGGTPAYMAPEMAQEFLRHIGRVRDQPDHASGKHSDIYLLGAILFHFLVGHPPHSSRLPGPSREQALDCLTNAARNEFTAVSAVEGEAEELLTIAYRAMATDPADRFPSVAELQAELREYQNHVQSIVLAQRAEKELSAGQESQHYETLARAQFAFQDALELWSANHTAASGLRRAKRAFAHAAYEKQDYDLGISLLDPQDAADREWRDRMLQARSARDARRVRLRLATLSSLLLLASLLGGALWFSRSLNHKNVQLAAQRDAARSAEENARAEEQRAREAEAAAREAQEQEEQQRQAAEEARSAAEQSQLLAEQEATRARQAEQSARYGRFVSDIALADARLTAGDPRRARELLERLRQEDAQPPGQPQATSLPSVVDWEWHYLYHRCHPEVMTRFAGGQQALVAITRDGKRVATCALDGGHEPPQLCLQISDARSQRVLQEQRQPLSGPRSTLECIAISDDGRWVLVGMSRETASADREVQADLVAWDTEAEAITMLAAHHGGVYGVVTLPSTRRFLTAGLRHSPENLGVKLWTLSDSGVAAERLHPELENDGHNLAARVSALSLTDDGRRLADLSRTARRAFPEQPYRLMIRELDETGSERARRATLLPIDLPRVTAMAFRPGAAQELWLATDDGQLHQALVGPDLVVALQTQRPTPHVQPMTSLGFAPSGGHLFSAGRDSAIIMWETGAEQSQKRLLGHGSAITSCAAATVDSQPMLVSADVEGEVRHWRPWDYFDALILPADPAWGDLTTSTSGNSYTALGSSRGRVGLWDLSGRPLGEFSLGHQQPQLQRVLYSAASERLLTVSADGSVWSVDPRSGVAGELLPPQESDDFDPVRDICVSANGRWLVRISGRGQQVWRCDLQTGLVMREGEIAQTQVYRAALSSNGTLLAVTGNREAEFRFRRLSDNVALLDGRKFLDCLYLGPGLGEDAYVAVCQVGRRHLLLRWSEAEGVSQEVEVPWTNASRVWSSPSGRWLILAGEDADGLRAYDTTNLSVDARWLPAGLPTADLRDVAWDDTEERAYLLCDGVEPLYRWDVSHDRWDTHPLSESLRETHPSGLVASGTGRFSSYSASALHVWDAATGAERVRWQPENGVVELFHLGPDPVTHRDCLLTFSEDRVLRLWDVHDLVRGAGQRQALLLRSNFRPPSDPIRGVVLVPETNQCWVWWQREASPGAMLGEFHPWSGEIQEVCRLEADRESPTCIAGQRSLAVLGGDQGGVWVVARAADDQAAQVVYRGQGLPEPIEHLSLSRDESRLAVGGTHDVRVLALEPARVDDASAVEITAVPIAANRLQGLVFAPSGRRLLVGRADGSLTLWHVEPDEGLQQQLIGLSGHQLPPRHVEFTPNGHRLISLDARQAVLRFSAGWDAN